MIAIVACLAAAVQLPAAIADYYSVPTSYA